MALARGRSLWRADMKENSASGRFNPYSIAVILAVSAGASV